MITLIQFKLSRIFPLIVFSLFVGITGCKTQSKIPPPESALIVFNHIKEGYNKEDMELFCQDFSDIMFTDGFTKKAFLDVVQGLKQKWGNWESETYWGVKEGTYEWRIQYTRGESKLVLVLNNQNKVTGLWFRQ